MKYEILWMDDEPQRYLNLWKEINEIENIYLSPIIKPDSLAQKTYHSKPDLFILDYKLYKDDTKKSEFKLSHLLRLTNDTPFIIFTNFVDDVLNDADITKNSNFIKAFDKEDKNQILSFINEISQFKPIKICHLSDIHFESRNEKQTIDEQFKRLDQFYESIKDENTSLTLISGDIANVNLKEDYSKLGSKLQEIFTALYGENFYDNLFVIPGNHDMQWQDFSNSKLGDYPYAQYLKFYSKLIPNYKSHLEQFQETISGEYSNLNTCWHRQFGSKISLIGINSTIENESLKGLGIFTKDHESFLKKHWNKPKLNGELRILAIHHNLFVPPSVDLRQEKEHLRDSGVLYKNLFQYSCDLVLSGHTHYPAILKLSGNTFINTSTSFQTNNGFYNISSGTFGGYTANLKGPNYFSIIKLLPDLHNNVISWRFFLKPFQYNNDHVWQANEQFEYFMIH